MEHKYTFGVDYYPEHWPKERWETDAEMMEKLGLEVVRLAEFSWHKMEPNEGEFHFEWLDEILEILLLHGISTVLGTPSAAPPKWLIDRDPDILPVEPSGKRCNFGGRHHDCQSNETYRSHIRRFVTAMARHFANNPAVVGWQIDNELGNSHQNLCMCSSCEKHFQDWLRDRYKTIEKLNEAWGTYFWSQEYDDFIQIEPPRANVTEHNPSQMLDWKRFCSDLIVDFQQMQIDIIRKICPSHFITHNFMGFAGKVNYFDLAKNLDFISQDQYTLVSVQGEKGPFGIKEPPYISAAVLDFMRSTKAAPFWVMEQQSGITGWTHMAPAPRPGQIRLWTANSVAHGADTIVYFRWRSCLGGTEQYWHGVLPHSGIPGRAYEEIRQTVADLKPVMQQVQGSMPKNEVGILFSYDQEYAFQIQPHHPEFDYIKYVAALYQGIYSHHAGVDFIPEQGDFKKYRVLVAPLQYLMSEELEQRFQAYVQNGGHLVLTMRTGVKDKNNLCMSHSRLPGNLGKIAGIEVGEYDCLRDFTVKLRWDDQAEGTASKWCDIITLKDAKALLRYDSEFYAGQAAVTKHSYGNGKVYYIGTEPDSETMERLMGLILEEAAIQDHFQDLPQGTEITFREKEGKKFAFVLNHDSESKALTLSDDWACLLGDKGNLPPYGVNVYLVKE